MLEFWRFSKIEVRKPKSTPSGDSIASLRSKLWPHHCTAGNSCLRGIIAYNADYRKCDGVSSSSFQFCDANSCRDNTTCQQFGDSNIRITQCLPEINGAMKQGQNKCLLFPSIFYSLMIQDVCRARALSFDASISLAVVQRSTVTRLTPAG